MDSLKGKVVIVTGGSAGIGLATVQTLNSYGSKVLACDISEAPESVLKLQDVRFLRIDLTESRASEKVIEEAVAAFGRIDGLLNIAGVMDTGNSVDTLTDEVWSRCIAVNLTAPVKLMQAVIPHMLKAGKGSIVNVASKAGISGFAAGIAYTSSKHGLVGATKNVAFRFRENRIRCNAICPGAVKTNMLQSINSGKMDAAVSKLMEPIRSLAQVGDGIGIAEPQSQADILAFLISDLSSEISGAIISVDHGWSAM